MNKGRHAAETSSSFYRDLTMMLLGIALVGAAVFLLLYLFAGNPDAEAGASTNPQSTTTVATSSEPTATTSSTTPATTTSATTGAPATTAVPVRPPQEVRVIVLNSIGLDGAGGRKTQQLADAGYQTQQADDLEPQQDQSRVWYRDGFAAEANALLEFLPNALVEPLPDPELQSGADVILVLGAGYTE